MIELQKYKYELTSEESGIAACLHKTAIVFTASREAVNICSVHKLTNFSLLIKLKLISKAV